MPRKLRPAGIIAAPLVIALAGCAGEPTIQTGDDAQTIMGTLNRVDNSRVAMAYVDPVTDFSRYETALVMTLDLDNVEIIQPTGSSTSMVNRFNREWALDDNGRSQLQSAFAEIMARELTRDGAFTMAESGGDDVIAIEAMITAIAPTAPQDSPASRSAGRTRVYTENAGSMSIAIAFADGDSGEVLAIIKDARSAPSGTWGVNNSVTNMSEVRRLFSSWASQVRDGLLGLRERSANMNAGMSEEAE